MKAPRICICGMIVPHGSMCICQIKRKAEADLYRPTATERGYGSRWNKARATYLLSHPHCAMIVADGNRCTRSASVVDHIKPHRGDNALFWDKTNWQSLCGPCHNGRKQSLERRTNNRNAQ
jgi:5-methylcytosine-specific restriction protein A